MLDRILLEDVEDIGGYVDLAEVAGSYRRMLQEAESTNGYDVQAVWRTVVLALWLHQQRAVSRGAVAVG